MLIEWDNNITLEPFKPLYDTDATIILVWGGRDSGKSFAIPQVLTKKALKYKDFRCMAVRKNLNTVSASIFDRFKFFLQSKGLDVLTSTTKTPIEIKFSNGSDILGRGCDDVAKIKSTTDPSDAFIDEADQITENDFDVIFTTLRSNSVPIQIWLAFNPEVDAGGSSWIKEKFFKGWSDEEMYKPYKEFTIDIQTQDEVKSIKCLSIHTTLDTNPYAKDRAILYDSYREQDINKYNVWRLGRWGTKQVNSPFAWAFKDEMVQEFELDYDYPIDISFDFNVAPCTATISQQSFDRSWKRFLYEVRVGTKEDKSNVYGVCEVINRIIPQGLPIRVTGDSTGANNSALVYDNLDAYDIICEQLGVSQNMIHTPKKNPLHKDSYFEVNDRLVNRDITFHPRMINTINDLKQVEYRDKKILKEKAESKGMGHLLDCVRYDINTFFY